MFRDTAYTGPKFNRTAAIALGKVASTPVPELVDRIFCFLRKDLVANGLRHSSAGLVSVRNERLCG
jgi:hypothetical protein